MENNLAYVELFSDGSGYGVFVGPLGGTLNNRLVEAYRRKEEADHKVKKINTAADLWANKKIQEAVEAQKEKCPLCKAAANNIVACASCHAPVEVTALNAVRCPNCPTPIVEKAVEAFRERVAMMCSDMADRLEKEDCGKPYGLRHDAAVALTVMSSDIRALPLDSMGKSE